MNTIDANDCLVFLIGDEKSDRMMPIFIHNSLYDMNKKTLDERYKNFSRKEMKAAALILYHQNIELLNVYFNEYTKGRFALSGEIASILAVQIFYLWRTYLHRGDNSSIMMAKLGSGCLTDISTIVDEACDEMRADLFRHSKEHGYSISGNMFSVASDEILN